MTETQPRRVVGTIDRLPPAIRDGIVERLIEGALTQIEIVAWANEALVAEGEDPITRFAVNRFSKRVMANTRAMVQAKEAVAAVSKAIGRMPEGDVGAYLVETVRLMGLEIAHAASGQDPDLDVVIKLGRLVKNLEDAGASADRRIRAWAQAAAEKVETAARAQGLSSQQSAAIRAVFEAAGDD